VTPIQYPAVSRSKSRFRFTVTALHDRSDLDYALLALKLAFAEAGLGTQEERAVTSHLTALPTAAAQA